VEAALVPKTQYVSEAQLREELLDEIHGIAGCENVSIAQIMKRSGGRWACNLFGVPTEGGFSVSPHPVEEVVAAAQRKYLLE
jgi:hypothetical protein